MVNGKWFGVTEPSAVAPDATGDVAKIMAYMEQLLDVTSWMHPARPRSVLY